MYTKSGKPGVIDFIEDFALAEDRTISIAQLIPGTEDFYYYQALNLLNISQFEKVEEILTTWINRYDRTDRVIEIEHRKALLEYDTDPEKTLAYLKNHFNLYFDHQKYVQNINERLPSSLSISDNQLNDYMKKAITRYSGTTNGIEVNALPSLLKKKTPPDILRHILQRIERPDIDKLADYIVNDLKHPDSSGFGTLTIHNKLTLNQLDQCIKLMPNLKNETGFVQTYLKRLQPENHINIDNHTLHRKNYIKRVWQFVEHLDNTHNSLKAHVLYYRLKHDHNQGEYNNKIFEKYIRIPKSVPYANNAYILSDQHRYNYANLHESFQTITLFPSVTDDQPLIKEYLRCFFIKNKTYKEFKSWIDEKFLREFFAETMILSGIGDMEKWYSNLPAGRYEQLKNRVDLDFTDTNKKQFNVKDNVTLELRIKNINALIIKVFNVNAENYYRNYKKEMDTDIDLDGLVAHHERIITIDTSPFISEIRHFDFPEIDGNGVFIVEFIGNGKSSRAVIRKGNLTLHETTGASGHILTVFDENNQKVHDFTVTIAGHGYNADNKGFVNIPYTTAPGIQPVIIKTENFASLDRFLHKKEVYQLKASIYIDRESLIENRTASVIIRPFLLLNGTPVKLKLLENPVLEITTTDHDNVSTWSQVRDITFSETSEYIYNFKVPARLHRVKLRLSAQILNLSMNTDIDLSDHVSFTLNEINKSEKTEDLFLARDDGQYIIELLGKCGEPLPDRAVTFSLKFHQLTDEYRYTLQTDKVGRLYLGDLKQVKYIQSEINGETNHKWELCTAACSWPSTFHIKAGESLQIPSLGEFQHNVRDLYALFELRNSDYYKDCFKNLSVKNGFLSVKLETSGDYELHLKQHNRSIKLRVAEKKSIVSDSHIMDSNRHLEVTGSSMLNIVSVKESGSTVKIQLKNNSHHTRLHLFVTDFLPAYSVFEHLDKQYAPLSKMIGISDKKSVYISGRNIGDEYKYILDRKYAVKFPGNLLQKPALLINPWAIGKTDAESEALSDGEEWGAVGEAPPEELSEDSGSYQGNRNDLINSFSSYDFLNQNTITFFNLIPDKNGIVSIQTDVLNKKSLLNIISIDNENTVYRMFHREKSCLKAAGIADQKHQSGLDPIKHYTQKNDTSIIGENSKFTIKDSRTADYSVFNSLENVYQIFSAISSDATLPEFHFCIEWPELSLTEKMEKYSNFACHELNFFLYKKDRSFFTRAILPFLENKKDLTFLDSWLIHAGGSTRVTSDQLSEYLTPWKYSKLNLFEKILLSKTTDMDKENIQRDIRDRLDILSPDLNHNAFLFNSALKGASSEKVTLSGDSTTAFAGAPPSPRSYAEPDMPGSSTHRMKKAIFEKEEAFDEELDDLIDDYKDECLKSSAIDVGIGGDDFDDDLTIRKASRAFYRKLDTTEEFAENNYYRLTIAEQTSELITINDFWYDFAKNNKGNPFLSTSFLHATNNFTEMLIALSLLDFPFKNPDLTIARSGCEMSFIAERNCVVFHREIKEFRDELKQTGIMVKQNFFKQDDRYHYKDGYQHDKFIEDAFLSHSVYGCQVVITNPSQLPLKLNVLTEIPNGSVPVLGSMYNKNTEIELYGFSTETLEFFFYFPDSGKYNHLPVHISVDDNLVAYEKPFEFSVVNHILEEDSTSWEQLSQDGSNQDVTKFLTDCNLNLIEIDSIAFRMRNLSFYKNITDLLTKRHVYNETLWSYAFFHNDPVGIAQFIQFSDSFTERIGNTIDCTLLSIAPITRKTFQYLEYKPLINPRVHRTGKRPAILNEQFHRQYHKFLKTLTYKNILSDEDLMTIVSYLFLQDRVEEAGYFYQQIRQENLATKIQYDYFAVYFLYSTQTFDTAVSIAEKYLNYPVIRWQKLFKSAYNVINQLVEKNKLPSAIDSATELTHHEKHDLLAESEPSLEFIIRSGKIIINTRNITKATINYYLMDIELLFSKTPFVHELTGNFSNIMPDSTTITKVSLKDSESTVDIPDKYINKNIMVEVEASSIKKSLTHYANNVTVHVIENYGQLLIKHKTTGAPLSTAYVKVYARFRDGSVQFYKDGYSDPSGRFDYVSLNTDELTNVSIFSIMILSEESGVIVKEAAPPKT